MNKIITMTYETIKRIHIFKTLNEDIMDFINPSIKTYKKMFNETIERMLSIEVPVIVKVFINEFKKNSIFYNYPVTESL